MSRKRLIEDLQFSNVVPAADLDGGAVAGGWINMSNFSNGGFLVNLGAIASTGGYIIQLRQAKTNAGGSAKDLELVDVSSPEDKTASMVSYKAGAGALAQDVSLNIASGGVTIPDTADNGAVLIEFRSEDLDVNNEFTHVQFTTTADPGASSLGAVTFIGKCINSDPDGSIDITA